MSETTETTTTISKLEALWKFLTTRLSLSYQLMNNASGTIKLLATVTTCIEIYNLAGIASLQYQITMKTALFRYSAFGIMEIILSLLFIYTFEGQMRRALSDGILTFWEIIRIITICGIIWIVGTAFTSLIHVSFLQANGFIALQYDSNLSKLPLFWQYLNFDCATFDIRRCYDVLSNVYVLNDPCACKRTLDFASIVLIYCTPVLNIFLVLFFVLNFSEHKKKLKKKKKPKKSNENTKGGDDENAGPDDATKDGTFKVSDFDNELVELNKLAAYCFKIAFKKEAFRDAIFRYVGFDKGTGQAKNFDRATTDQSVANWIKAIEEGATPEEASAISNASSPFEVLISVVNNLLGADMSDDIDPNTGNAPTENHGLKGVKYCYTQYDTITTKLDRISETIETKKADSIRAKNSRQNAKAIALDDEIKSLKKEADELNDEKVALVTTFVMCKDAVETYISDRFPSPLKEWKIALELDS